MATYHFDTELASIYGVEEAILIYNLQFWINKNKANSCHQYDGRTWTYNSYKAFAKLFPFWNPGKIRRVIKSLVDKGVIVEGNYNKMKADRTKWYAFTEETGPIYKSDSPCVGSDSPCVGSDSPCVGSGAPIPDTKHSYNKQHISNPKREDGESSQSKPLLPIEIALRDSQYAQWMREVPFLAAWADWEQHRKEKRQKLTPSTTKKQLAMFSKLDEATAIAMIDQSITKGWIGLVELQDRKDQSSGSKPGEFNEKIDIPSANSTSGVDVIPKDFLA